MLALQRLQEKIEEWRRDHEALKEENRALKEQLEATEADRREDTTLQDAHEACKAQCRDLEEEIARLKRELEERDIEIDKIVTQVEALLS